jgi:hypothetical protein
MLVKMEIEKVEPRARFHAHVENVKTGMDVWRPSFDGNTVFCGRVVSFDESLVCVWWQEGRIDFHSREELLDSDQAFDFWERKSEERRGLNDHGYLGPLSGQHLSDMVFSGKTNQNEWPHLNSGAVPSGSITPGALWSDFVGSGSITSGITSGSVSPSQVVSGLIDHECLSGQMSSAELAELQRQRNNLEWANNNKPFMF